MSIIRGAAIDILVTIFIVIATVLELAWGRWALLVYTALMLLLKIAAVWSGGLRQMTTQQKRAAPPLWVYHLLYAINVIALGLAGWWLLFVGWGAIWILSIVIERRV
jgi:hypothetical protein